MEKTATKTCEQSKRLKRKITPKPKKPLPQIQLIENKVLKAVIGQDEHVRKILTAIYRSRTFKNDRGSTLIIGGSGTGKTETLRQIMPLLKIPYIIEDATNFTKEGYTGRDVGEIVFDLIEKAKNNFEEAERGVIIIDEIDKKATSKESFELSGVDVGGSEVLKSFLKIMEGTIIEIDVGYDVDTDEPKTYSFDTTNITFIFMGAFTGIEEIIKSRTKSNIGFVGTKTNSKEHSKMVLKSDLVKYGLIDEFVGRISSIIKLNDLTENDLLKILKVSTISPIKRYASELGKLGVKIQVPPELYRNISRKAKCLKTGARELATIVDGLMSEPLYEVFANPGKYKECVLKGEILENPSQFELF